MASLFDELEADAQAATEDMFGDAIRVLPRLPSEYTEGAADPGRSARDAIAVVSFGIADDIIEGVRRGTDLRGTTTFAARSAEAWMSAVAYAGLGYTLRKGDAITHNGAKFAISHVAPDAGGFRLALTREAT